MRMTARASCKTDEKVQLSLLPSVSYSPTPKPANIASTTEEEGDCVVNAEEEGDLRRRQRKRKEISVIDAEEGGLSRRRGGRSQSPTRRKEISIVDARKENRFEAVDSV